jgi:PPIC-type PPIASE domain
MSTQTQRPARKPTGGRSARNSRRYTKQTAHVEARRDGKPLIFGWGKHLSHTEKVRMQRRGIWGMAILVVLVLAGVIVGAWINLNIIIPGLAITSVNGHAIPQSEYREMVAVKTQVVLNELYGPDGLNPKVTSLQKQDAQVTATINSTNTTISNLNKQIKNLPSNSSQLPGLQTQLKTAQTTLSNAQSQDSSLQSQINDLKNTQIPIVEQGFTQSQIGNDSVHWLQDDELIREWLTTQSPAVQNKINPTANQVNSAFNTLKRQMPTTNGYNTMLSSMGVSDSNVLSMLTIIERRDNLQNYLKPQLKSPSYQVLARQMTLPTQAKANQMLQDLQKGQDFGKLAKANSSDSNTASKGGDLGWITRYQYIDDAGSINGPAAIDNWLFDPSRKLNEISPVIYAGGSYYIVQLLNVDPSRSVDSTLLQSLQSNALVNWLQERGGNGIPLPGQNITSPDQNMLTDARNMPQNNILPSSAPALATPTPTVASSTPTPAATSTP